ncbi:hypothetical protein V1527DRAFT_522224 [Lipomyces starkeyi]
MSESATTTRNACVACTKAKRKCSKQTPACRRCVDKKIVCRYSAPRVTPPYDLVFSQDGVVSVVPAPNQVRPVAQQATAGPLIAQIYFTDESLPYFIVQLRSWLRQWTSEGRCPFIHSNLWKSQLPDCVQDRLLQEKMVLRIIEQRVNRLVEEQNSLSGDIGVIMLDTATHLAKTQALLIYKIIRLFDGDIRARAQAENPQSLDQAKGPLDLDSEGLVNMQLRTDGTLASTWQAWIFAESIRRTNLTATLSEAVYAIPSDVDEFTDATLIVSYGLERFEQWHAQNEIEALSS